MGKDEEGSGNEMAPKKADILEAIIESWKNVNIRFIRNILWELKKNMKEVIKYEGNLQ